MFSELAGSQPSPDPLSWEDTSVCSTQAAGSCRYHRWWDCSQLPVPTPSLAPSALLWGGCCFWKDEGMPGEKTMRKPRFKKQKALFLCLSDHVLKPPSQKGLGWKGPLELIWLLFPSCCANVSSRLGVHGRGRSAPELCAEPPQLGIFL